MKESGLAVVNAANAWVIGQGMVGVTEALYKAVGDSPEAWSKLVDGGRLFRDGAFAPLPAPLFLSTCLDVLRTGTSGELEKQPRPACGAWCSRSSLVAHTTARPP